MASRFYLTASTVLPGIAPAFAGWTRTTEGVRRVMSTTKDGSAMTSITTGGNANAAADATLLAVQFISAPLAAGVAFATTDTIKCVIRGQESAANDNINRNPLCLRVLAGDGSTVRATLFALAHGGPSTTEWSATALTNRQFADGDVLAANYTTVDDDYLVLEVGAQVSAAAGTSVTGTLSFGANSASDLAENETGTAADNPFFEISRDVSFRQSDYGSPRGTRVQSQMKAILAH